MKTKLEAVAGDGGGGGGGGGVRIDNLSENKAGGVAGGGRGGGVIDENLAENKAGGEIIGQARVVTGLEEVGYRSRGSGRRNDPYLH